MGITTDSDSVMNVTTNSDSAMNVSQVELVIRSMIEYLKNFCYKPQKMIFKFNEAQVQVLDTFVTMVALVAFVAACNVKNMPYQFNFEFSERVEISNFRQNEDGSYNISFKRYLQPVMNLPHLICFEMSFPKESDNGTDNDGNDHMELENRNENSEDIDDSEKRSNRDNDPFEEIGPKPISQVFLNVTEVHRVSWGFELGNQLILASHCKIYKETSL